MLYGKGVFIYQIERCEEGDARRIVERALAAGLRHVAIKIADGDRAYPFATAAERQTREAIGALQEAGLAVWGWHFIYGRSVRDPSQSIAQAEAEVAIQRAHQLGVHGFAVDFENTGHPRLTYRGDAEDARIYMEALRAALPEMPLASATHRFFNQNLPFDAFLSRSDLAMPQVYWVQGDPVRNLERSYAEYRRRFPALPYVPIGAAYYESGWGATPEEIVRFLNAARTLNLTGVSFWSWQHARNDPRFGSELWDVIAAFDWAPHWDEAPVWVNSLAWRGLRFRAGPGTDYAWIDNRLFYPGDRLTAIGHPTAPDANAMRWQNVRAPGGQVGWVVYSIGDEVYLSPSPPGERRMVVVAPDGLRLRERPFRDSSDPPGVPFGATVIAIGDPSPVDAAGYRWQRVRLADGRTGFMAYSQGDEVYLA
ncbi:MAG: hypothetical protein K6U78_04580 [Anaerolineae bacterium]|jgi:hypothetical protein|nr:hypothetical protein [Anaerolineae bacterium]